MIMNMFCFVLWMLGYPLVCAISSYLGFLSGKVYSSDVNGIASFIVIIIWAFVGWLIWGKV